MGGEQGGRENVCGGVKVKCVNTVENKKHCYKTVYAVSLKIVEVSCRSDLKSVVAFPFFSRWMASKDILTRK